MKDPSIDDDAGDTAGDFRAGRTPGCGVPVAEIYALANAEDAAEFWWLLAQEELSRPVTWDDDYFRHWADALTSAYAGKAAAPAAWVIVVFDAAGRIAACVEYRPVFRAGLLASVSCADVRASKAV